MTERKKAIGRVMGLLTAAFLLISVAMWMLGRLANAEWRDDLP